MALNANGMLNLEPSQSKAYEENHSAAKTYADSVRQDSFLPPRTNGDIIEKSSNGHARKEVNIPEQYVGQGEDNAPRSPVRKPHKRNGSIRAIGAKKEKDDHSLVVERFQDTEGEKLTSITTTSIYEEGVRLGEKEKKPSMKHNERHELVSGRRAGAGWQRSGYDIPYL